ncbi:MAG TPA: HAMP domain-containing sensor histidine kinase [Trueperaceae bacterium]|nr:HAMP domain-containing sensor histidine kinase [Trueperaceae bacterium]
MATGAIGRDRQGEVAARRGSPLKLRTQVALVIAFLSALPNIILVVTALLPVYRAADGNAGGILGWPVALWLLGVVALSALVGYFLSGQLLAPLMRAEREVEGLPRTVSRLAAARVPVRADDPPEVAALKGSFNALLAQVEVQESRRNAFTAALMHDLKTPLIAANNLLNVVRDDDALDRASRVDLVKRLGSEMEALIDLVQKMVDAHRLERSDVPLTRRDVNLLEVVDRVIRRLQPLLDEREIAVSITGNGRALVDDREAERALYNLISNAVRYAKRQISLEVFNGMVRLQDDGPGLPAPLEQLALPFVGRTVEIAGKEYAGGTGGLGLFIARRVLEAHGGQLVCEATGPNGTVFLAYFGR